MNNLIWFRNDLRIGDNSSLNDAVKGQKVIAFYCFETIFFDYDNYGFKRTGKYRTKFLLETITQLKAALEKLSIALFIYVGQSKDFLPFSDKVSL